MTLPAAFRVEYGDELGRAFAARRRAVTNLLAVAGLWASALADLLRNAALVQAEVLRQGLGLVALGGLGGLLLAYAAGRGLEALLAGIGPSDPLTFAAAIALALLAALAGSLPPALRAVRANPAQLLRGS